MLTLDEIELRKSLFIKFLQSNVRLKDALIVLSRKIKRVHWSLLIMWKKKKKGHDNALLTTKQSMMLKAVLLAFSGVWRPPFFETSS